MQSQFRTWFRRLLRHLLFQTVHDLALMVDRCRAGREAGPSAAVLDSQTIKASHAPGGGGYDAAKSAPRRRASSMEEGSIRRVVD